MKKNSKIPVKFVQPMNEKANQIFDDFLKKWEIASESVDHHDGERE